MHFSALVDVFEKMESTSKRLEMTDDLAKLFKETPKSEIKKVVYLCQGQLLPEFTGIELGIGDKLAEQAIALASGKTIKEISESYKKTGDLGITAKDALEKKHQHTLASEKLTVEKVYGNLYKLATSSGSGSQDQKIKLLADLLGNATPGEAKVIARFVTGTMRLGAGEATIIDAFSVMKRGDKSLREELERAYNLTSDLGAACELLVNEGEGALKKAKPKAMNPIRPALAERLNSAKDIFEKLGECAVEGKYDGFRVQIHKKGNDVEIFSRKQEKMTHMFPEIVEAVRNNFKASEAIFEGEAIAFDEKKKKFLPFQKTIQRKRKHGVAEKAREMPLKLFAYELLLAEGKDYTHEPYSERRKKLESLVKKGKTIELAEMKTAKSAAELESFFRKSVAAGLEGIIAKELTAPYVAGARKFAWIKLKKSYSEKITDSFDLAVIGFYLGKGKRTKFGFGGLLTAVFDDKHNKFKSVAKLGTGFSEEQMKWFEKTLGKDAVPKKPDNVESLLDADVWVKPKIVVEVVADEITRSPVHACARENKEGLALRFPRFIQVREDKSVKQATTEEEVKSMFALQGNS
ncbi:MAG: ATP-dependent DNA ligase [Candidatus Micrarchaeota archaeon]